MTHNTNATRQNTLGAFLAGALIGGLVGAVTALLRAPQPGWETRRQLQDAGLQLKTDVEEKVTEGRSAVERTLNQARESVSSLVEQGRSAIEREGHEVRSSIENELAAR